MKEYKLKINGNQYDVVINAVEGNVADVTVNGVSHKVEIEDTAAQAQAASPVQAIKTAAPKAAAPAGGKTVSSPLPGIIVEVSVQEGQAVKSGDKLAVLEAMKMENEILAEFDGTVNAIHVSKGDSVLEGAKIVTIG